MGETVGYIRISALDQNTARQLDGIDLDKCFIDKASGKSIAQRPKLQEMLDYIRSGDVLLVHSMDRLARNLDDLRLLVKKIVAKDVLIKFIKEQITFGEKDSPMSTLLLSVMGAFAEFERSIIKERQMEGIAIAKTKGKYKGRKKKLSSEQVLEIKGLVSSGENKSRIAQQYNISRETLYKYLKA